MGTFKEKSKLFSLCINVLIQLSLRLLISSQLPFFVDLEGILASDLDKQNNSSAVNGKSTKQLLLCSTQTGSRQYLVHSDRSLCVTQRSSSLCLQFVIRIQIMRISQFVATSTGHARDTPGGECESERREGLRETVDIYEAFRIILVVGMHRNSVCTAGWEHTRVQLKWEACAYKFNKFVFTIHIEQQLQRQMFNNCISH